MKYRDVCLFGLVLAAGLVAASARSTGGDPPKATPAAELKDLKSKASYGIGLQVGRQIKSGGVDIDTDLVAKGLKDAVSGAKPEIPDAQLNEALQTYLREAASAVPEKNKKAGDAFLAENKTKPGVVTLPSGLQYKVLKEGTGPMPKATDTVECHYRGTLLDGTPFDSSYDRGQPAQFEVRGLIPGWVEALQKMKVGSKWQLYIPSDLAYGKGGRAPITPNSTLIFEMELLKIVK